MRMGIDDQLLNLKFVKEVEKREILYNYNLPGYSRKEEVQRAWREVSEAVNLSVPECRERWRNLRTVFIRKKKPSPKGSQTRRKAYYLADAMKFCLPYIKILAPPSFNKLEPEEEITFKPEKITEHENSSMDDISEITQYEQIFEQDLEQEHEHEHGHQHEEQEQEEEEETIFPEYIESKKRKLNSTSRNTSTTSFQQETKINCSRIEQKEALRMFLLSLMPEVENFSDSQIKQFKRRIFRVIDDISGVSYSNNDPLVNSTMM